MELTKEKAIKILKGAIKKPNTEDGYIGQALSMAISALEQEPCEVAQMSLDDAIKHAEEVADSRCDKCGQEHKQLASWLKELKTYKEQEPCDDIAEERHKDLCEYFGEAKDILESRKEFKAWLERVKWHIHKAEELYEKYEYKQEHCDGARAEQRFCETTTNNDEPIYINYPIITCEDTISRAEALDQLEQAYNIMDATDRVKAMPSVQAVCKDTINREAVIDILQYAWEANKDIQESIVEIKALSSVTPKPTECDDAISREEVLKPYKDLKDDDVISVWLIRKNIEQQKSVQPSRKGRHINIDDAIKALCPHDEDYDNPCISPHNLEIVLEQLCLDSGSVQPSHKGQWLHKEITDNYRVTGQCSECKERKIIDNYCANCGACMKEGAE